MQLTKNIVYLIGALRDGSVSRFTDHLGKVHHSITFYSKSIGWLKILQQKVLNEFRIETKIVSYSDKTPYIRIYSKKIAEMLAKEFQHPLKVQITWDTPQSILQIKDVKLIKWYIAGFWDAEGGINRNKQIAFFLSWDGNSCPPLEDIKKILEKKFNVRCGKVCGYENKNGVYPRFVLRILKESNEKFVKTFPLQNPEKVTKLKNVLSGA